LTELWSVPNIESICTIGTAGWLGNSISIHLQKTNNSSLCILSCFLKDNLTHWHFLSDFQSWK
jgi:hypothetical protein